MKMYFVCEYRGPEWWLCDGILENGFAFGQHLCSHPGFAAGDLYFTRKERIAAIKELFNLDEEYFRGNSVHIIVKSAEDIPSWWVAAMKKQDELKPLYEKYRALVGDTNAKISLEIP